MNESVSNEKRKCKILLKNLMDSVKECQNVYGKNKTLLATEKDVRVTTLCSNWEYALSHGLKTTSVFKNIVSGNLTTDTTIQTFWDFASQHLTGHEKERFSTLRYVYTDQGKVRALIRAALNERAMERYILIWLGDLQGLATHFETWAFIRDIEAINLLPSIAAGLGSILFAITVDSPDLNIGIGCNPNKLPGRSNEIIIAVPPPVANTKERKATNTKRTQIISFEESDESSMIANVFPSTSPKFLSNSEDSPASNSDSTQDQISNFSFDSPKPVETDYIQPESPTPVQILPPVTALKYQISSMFDFKELEESSIIKLPDSNSNCDGDSSSSGSRSSIVSTTATNSSVSVHQQESVTHSLHSSSTSINQTPASAVEAVSAVTAAATETENRNARRIHELEQRCVQLEELVTALQLENTRLKSVQHTLLGNRQRSKNFLVTIPRVSLKRDEQTRKKKYYAYEIHIQPIHENGDTEEWLVLRRYSDFYKLHKQLLKENAIIKTLDFPPKKSFGNMNIELVEQRRQRLQVYLLAVLSLMPDISKCNTRTQLEEVFPFFKPNS